MKAHSHQGRSQSARSTRYLQIQSGGQIRPFAFSIRRIRSYLTRLVLVGVGSRCHRRKAPVSWSIPHSCVNCTMMFFRTWLFEVKSSPAREGGSELEQGLPCSSSFACSESSAVARFTTSASLLQSMHLGVLVLQPQRRRSSCHLLDLHRLPVHWSRNRSLTVFDIV